jgi:polyhydroxyalkanoate synthesis regulator phasin
MQMSTKKKVAAIVITTVALTAGTIGVSSASSKSSAARVSTTRTVAGVTMMQGRGAEVASVLAALVAKGTITQAQSDAITAALVAADAAKPAKPLDADNQARLTLISSTIGVDAATIKTRLTAGETLAAIAGAKKDALIAALVADETKRIDAAVTAGKLTAAQATTLKSTLTAHVTTEVNSVRPMGPKGGEKGEHGRSGPKGGPMGSPTLTLPATPKA